MRRHLVLAWFMMVPSVVACALFLANALLVRDDSGNPTIESALTTLSYIAAGIFGLLAAASTFLVVVLTRKKNNRGER